MAIFCAPTLRLKSGVTFSDVKIAYECYGELNSEKSNAILVTHGTTSSHIAADEVTIDRRKGWWNEVIGPGLLFDTSRYCIVSSNVLGSCYGSTGPASNDPETGKPYGTSFPDVCLEDIVSVQILYCSLWVSKNLLLSLAPQSAAFKCFSGRLRFQNTWRAL